MGIGYARGCDDCLEGLVLKSSSKEGVVVVMRVAE